ncbi:MAG: hypothetical protein AAB483_01940 [Patescibacteria group bacterium]
MSIRNMKVSLAVVAVALAGVAFGLALSTPSNVSATDCTTYKNGARLNPFPVDYTGSDACGDYPLVSGKADGGSYPMSDAQLEQGTTLHAGQEGTVRIYVHNGALDTGIDGITTAKNVRVEIRTDAGTGTSHGVYVDAKADNASKISGGYLFKTSADETLEIIPGTLRILRDDLSQVGTTRSIGNHETINLGNQQGCYEHLRYITFKVRVVAPEVIATPTPTPRPTPNTDLTSLNCNLGPATPAGYESRTLVKFHNGINDPNNVWMSSKSGAGRRTQENAHASLPAGTYRVTLESFDDHPNQENQQREQYYLELKGSNGNMVARTNASRDIPQNQSYVRNDIVNTALVLGSAVSTIIPAHAAHPDNSSHNSLTAVCAAFDKVQSHTDLTPSLSISKRVLNVTQNSGEATSVTAIPGNTVEFVIRVTNSGTGSATNTFVSDTLPGRLNFISGSVTVDGSTASDNFVNGGININTTVSGQTREIRFRAQVAGDSQFSIGTETLVNTAYARADGTSTLSAQASVLVTKNTPVVVCSPSNQNINMNQYVSFSATGGNGTYSWSAPTGNPSGNTGSSFSTTYGSTGTKIVTVTSGNQSDTCSVYVQPNQGQLSISKRVSNITRGYGEAESVNAQPQDMVEFMLRVTNTGSANINNVIVSDTLPPYVTYLSGSTKVDGVNYGDGITTSGININTLTPGQTKTIIFRAQVSDSAQFSNNTLTLTNYGYARADGITQIYDTAQIHVTRQTSQLYCTPSYQYANVYQTVYLNAHNGTGTYSWYAANSTRTSGTGSSFSTSFNAAGTYAISVSDNAHGYATCTVYVNSTPSYGLTIHKTGRNVSKGEINEQNSLKAAPGDTLDFFIRVRNTSSVTANNVIVRDTLPHGLQYINNTTSLNGNLVADGIISGGINIGSLAPNQEAIVRFNAVVKYADYFAKGVTPMTNVAYTRADNIGEIHDDLPIKVHNGSVLVGIADPKTGAGSTVALSLALTVALALGYMAYTQTGFFRKHEAWSIVGKAKANKNKFNFVV